MQVGDLVIIRQDIKEFVSARGQTTGVVLGVHDPDSNPRLGLIMWSDGETENLYSDEIEIISKQERSKND